MSEPKAFLALDVGERRIGVARADSIAKIASPLVTLANDEDIFNQIKKLLSENNVSTLVVGLPRGLDGQETGQTKYVRDFNQRLQESLGITTVFQDEAVTSVMAEQQLREAKKPYSKEDIDMIAAQHILEDFLHSEIL